MRNWMCALALAGALLAQDKPDDQPADMKAYSAANALKDPAAKIAALEKFQRDFPKSDAYDAAGRGILSTLIKKMPEDQARIARQAKAILKRTKPAERPSLYIGFAGDYATAGILLKDAEDYARRSLKGYTEARFFAAERAHVKKGEPAPSEAEMRSEFQENLASRQAVLGRVLVKRGKAAEGRPLLEQAYAANPHSLNVAETLGDLALKAGDDARAFDYFTMARLTGRASKPAIESFAALYRKQHGGSDAGMAEYLDREYARRLPNPVKVERYRPDAARTHRVVLAEVFTGSGCPPCAGADLAFDAAMERYTRDELAVVMYHQHIPRPDPMVNPDSEARAKAYRVRAVPTYAIDGETKVGGGTRAMAPGVYAEFNPKIEKSLTAKQQAIVKVRGSVNGGEVKVHAVVDEIESEAEELELVIVLVEKEVRFNGENGVRFHPMVARAVKTFSIDSDEPEPIDHTFDLPAATEAALQNIEKAEAKGYRGDPYQFAEKKHQIDATDLGVVAFVQEKESHRVLQAAWTDLSAKGAHPLTEEE